MKTIYSILLATFLLTTGAFAQDVTTVQATSDDISDNLDLEAVASIFADSQDLEDFESRLNDPETKISNLDINEDGYVDYLRVVENADRDAHLITIQAVLAKDMFQDVATIEVDKDASGNARVQVVGDVYMYGNNYIIEPVFVQRPVIYSWFWGPRWVRWRSPYYYGFYPRAWNYWAPCTTFAYRGYIPTYIHYSHTFNYVGFRRSYACVNLHNRYRRNDWGAHRPHSSFAYRQVGHTNRKDLVASRDNAKPRSTGQTRSNATQRQNAKTDNYARSTRTVDNRRSNTVSTSTRERDGIDTRQRVRADWKPSAEREGRTSTVRDNKVVVTRNTGQATSRKTGNKPTSTRTRSTNTTARGTSTNTRTTSPSKESTRSGKSTRTTNRSSATQSRSTNRSSATRGTSSRSTPAATRSSRTRSSSSSRPSTSRGSSSSSSRSSATRSSSSKSSASPSRSSSSRASSGSSRSSSSRSSSGSSRSSSSKSSSSKSSRR